MLLPLQSLCPLLSRDQALCHYPGFVELRPQEPATKPDLIDELDDNVENAWKRHFHWKQPATEIARLGCYFVQNVQLWAPGVAVHDNRLLTDGSETDRGTQSTLPDLHPDGFFDIATPIDRVIDRPILIADGVNYRIWGHFLVEYLPRFAIARELLGEFFDELVIPLPEAMPDWATELLSLTCGVRPEAILRYRPMEERLICPQAVIPTYCYSGQFTFHSFMADYFGRFRADAASATRKICISRGGGSIAGSSRKFPERQAFENLAAIFGYEVVHPEDMTIAEQIAIFAEAAIVVGEFGSGMHNALFSKPGTIVGCLGFWNPIQLHIGFVCEHRSVYLTRGCIWPDKDSHLFQLNISLDSLKSFFERIERITEAIVAS